MVMRGINHMGIVLGCPLPFLIEQKKNSFGVGNLVLLS
jgi:hypothetical protein